MFFATQIPCYGAQSHLTACLPEFAINSADKILEMATIHPLHLLLRLFSLFVCHFAFLPSCHMRVCKSAVMSKTYDYLCVGY